MPRSCPARSRVIKKSGSDEDVFSAVGGLELGRHDPQLMPQAAPGRLRAAAEAAAPPLQGSEQAAPGAQHTAGDGGSSFGGPAIGDLPFSETPSRTLIVRNVSAAHADQELQQLFEVRIFTQGLEVLFPFAPCRHAGCDDAPPLRQAW